MKPHPPILVLGFAEATMLLRQREAASIAALISIHGPREFGVESPAPYRLDLEFDDVDVLDESDPMSGFRQRFRGKAAREIGLEFFPPTVSHVRQILYFTGLIKKVEGIVLCHCSAGISRSAATAMLCLAAWTGPGAEEECVLEIKRVRPMALPHAGLIRLGDRLLERKGKLVEAAGLEP